ncbi:MAG TPA: hypothetical protein VGN12_11235 [Pirellulales bacterium]|jgi:hypothetical protein
MKSIRLLIAMLILGVSVAGCHKESSVKKSTTVTSPEGSTTTTTETTVETSGKNPPAAPNP